MKYKLAIFDMDGTILNTLEDLTDSLNHVLLKHGYPTHSLKNVRNFVGNGVRRLIELSVPKGTSIETTEIIQSEYKAYYKSHCSNKTRPYNGILPLLELLRNHNCKTAVVSNKPDAAVKDLSSQYFKGLFDISVGDREGVLKKPAPDSVISVLEQLHFTKEDSVYIGDSEVDIDTAKNAEMDCIIVSWGFRDVDFLRKSGADMIVNTPQELAELIEIPSV